MADNSWWYSTSATRNKMDGGSSSSSSSSTALNSIGGLAIATFGWPTDIVDIKARPCLDHVSISDTNCTNLFQDFHKQLQQSAPPTSVPASGGGVAATGVSGSDLNLQMMTLGVSSQAAAPLDWNQALFRSTDDPNLESNLRTMLQEDRLSSNTSFQQETGMTVPQEQWRSHKMYPGSSEESSVTDFKQISQTGFQLDQFSDNSSQGLSTSFQMNSYGNPNLVQGFLGSDNQQQPGFESRSMGFDATYPSSAYIMNAQGDQFPPDQFLGISSPKQPLQFSNNTRYWNAPAAAMNNLRPNFFPSLNTQLPASTYGVKPKSAPDVVKKSNSESTKRPRNETASSASPAFKVIRKEKMGDRITALQQLVSPFGRTDTASVLSETIEYIKFLHEQVNALSTPYMKNGAAIMQHQQTHAKSSEEQEPDLRSRGLCLVPISSTFPVTHETTMDFWSPALGGTFR